MNQESSEFQESTMTPDLKDQDMPEVSLNP